MDKVSKLTGMVALGTGVLAAVPSGTEALPIAELEPNDTFPGQTVSMNVGDVINGTIIANINGQTGEDTHDVDFFKLIGLPAGGTATFSLDLGLFADPGELKVDVHSDATTVTSSKNFDLPLPVDFVVPIPASGELILAVKEQNSAAGVEAYNITLTQLQAAASSVPEPATTVLLAAGLAGGLHVALRRRKRG
jgi:hypothetical protein